MTFDAKADWPETPAFLRLYVADGDAVFQQALTAGATPVTQMTNMPWGDRVGRVRDPLGNLWWIMTRVEDLTPEEIANSAGEIQTTPRPWNTCRAPSSSRPAIGSPTIESLRSRTR